MLPAPGLVPTADGEVLLTRRTGTGPVHVVLAHGFGMHSGRASVQRLADALSPVATVHAVDLRGHGRSSGASTLGVREVLDVDACVAAARAAGAERVVTLGCSMGGTAVLRHAGLRGREVFGHVLAAAPDAVVSVSATSTWEGTTAALRRLRRLVLTRTGRLATRAVLRTRVAPGFDGTAAPPLGVVGAVAPLPLLLVHGTADHYFGVEHARALAAAAPHARLHVEPGMGHAEDALTPDVLTLLREALTDGSLLARPVERSTP